MKLYQTGIKPTQQAPAAAIHKGVWTFGYGLLAALMLLTSGVHAQALPSTLPQMPQDAPLAPPKATQGYHLAELIDLALANNPELAASGFERDAAAARTQGANAALGPRVSVEGAYTAYGDDLRVTAARFNGEAGAFGSQILNADLVLRVPLYTGGRLQAELNAAQLLEAASSQRLARSKSDLIFNVSSLYYAQLAQGRLIGALIASRDALAGQLQRVQALVNERKAAKVDALRTEVKLADVRQRLLREQNGLEILRRTLLNLLGDTAGERQIVLVDALQKPTPNARPLDALVQDALAQRPDVRAAQAELDAQKARIQAARAVDAPTLNLTASAGGRKLYGISQQPAGIDSQDTTYRVGLSFDVPLFDGGRTTARVAEESAKLAAQQARLDKLRLQVRLDIETAHAALTSALERLASTEQLTALATENLRIEEEKYRLMRGTLFDVLDAQSALTDAQATHIRALADANTAAAHLAWASAENLL